MTLVNVVIPTYNSARTLPGCIQSVLNQTWVDFEILVVDDGSTDDTQDLLAGYGSPVKYIYQEHQERSAARNTGLRFASGDFVAFLDSDDTWLPDKLAKQVKAFLDNPALDMVYSQAYVVDESGNTLGLTGSYPDLEDGETLYCRLLLGNFIPSMTPLVRRTLCDKAGGFDTDLRQGEDWEYWLRLAAHGRIAMIPEPLARYHVNSQENLLEKMADRQVHQAYQAIIEKARRKGNCPAAVIDMAFAMNKLSSMVVETGLGNFVAGQTFLHQALDLVPGLFKSSSSLAVARIVNLVLQTYQGQQGAEAVKGRQLLKQIWRLSPYHQDFTHLERKAIGQLHASHFFRAAKLNDRKRMYGAMLPMLFNDPSMVSNRGVWALALKGLFTLEK